MNLPGVGEECVICLSDFVSGEQVKLLPKCHHGFHVHCIDKWLQQHLTCPKCRHCLVETCQKILGDDQVSAAPTESVIIRIAPLEPSSAQGFQEQFLDGFVSRKLLLENPFGHNTQRAYAVAPSDRIPHENNHSGNFLMLLLVLLCGIICCLGLHYISRWALRRSSRFSDPDSEMNLPGVGEECVICLSDFVSGEKIRLLPKCHHGFHVRCIDKWLQQHLTCPKCRHCLVETCQKILGADQVSAAPAESVIVRIAPLEPEGRVNTFRESS